jgi:hypothetical protein
VCMKEKLSEEESWFVLGVGEGWVNVRTGQRNFLEARFMEMVFRTFIATRVINVLPLTFKPFLIWGQKECMFGPPWFSLMLKCVHLPSEQWRPITGSR